MGIEVSVVIPTYNQNLNYLAEAIESTLRQTYPKEKYEILVVDDGSTRILPDPLFSRLMNKQNVKFIKKEHGRTAHTLNAGIRRMKGNYFKWLSSDDALCEDALETLMSTADENRILYGDWIKMDENSRTLDVSREPVFTNSHEMKRWLWSSFFGNGDTVLIPKSAFKRIGMFDSSLPYYEDYDWWLRAAFLGNYKFSHVGEIIAKYRIHQSQITAQLRRRDKEKMVAHWLIKRRIYKALSPASRADANPNPSIRFLIRSLFMYDSATIYRGFAGINQYGRARTPKKLRKLASRLIGP